jgi:hypothetical protein
VCPPHQAFGFKLGKIAPDAGSGRAQPIDQYVERKITLLPQFPQDLIRPIPLVHLR